MYCSRQVSEAQEWARARESKREQEKTSERKRQRKRFTAGKRPKGQKRRKRRHLGTLRDFTGQGDERDAAGLGGARAMPSLKSLGNAWWQECAKQTPGKSLDCQCLRLTSAVALVPCVPSVPSLVAGRSLKVRRTLNFRKLSPTKRKPFAVGKGHKGPKRQKRRHLGTLRAFTGTGDKRDATGVRRTPLQCRPLSPLEMPGGRSARSNPLENHLTANACA